MSHDFLIRVMRQARERKELHEGSRVVFLGQYFKRRDRKAERLPKAPHHATRARADFSYDFLTQFLRFS